MSEKWNRHKFEDRLREFMRDNPDLNRAEACSVLGKRGAENRRKDKVQFTAKPIIRPATVYINNVNVYFNSKETKSPKQIAKAIQLELGF